MLAMTDNRCRNDQVKAFCKEQHLEKLLGKYDLALIAFSGGVDSTYLLYKAAEIIGPDNIFAVTVDSELTLPEEIEKARQLAEGLGFRFNSLKLDLLAVEAIKKNDPQRCYSCKKLIYSELLNLAANSKLSVVMDGTNADDPNEHRPGLRALKELGVLSPLLEAGLVKDEIRLLSRKAGLVTWDKPASPCLATRFPYGKTLTAEGLQKIALAESFLRDLGVTNNLRVRYHDNLARIEVDQKDFNLIIKQRKIVLEILKAYGFSYVTLDLGGFSSGSMDR